MIKQSNNLIQNYTDSDLHFFAILEDFSSYNIISSETKNKQQVHQSVGYTHSDDKQFKKLMNFNKNTKTSPKEYSIDDFSDSEDLTDKRTNNDDSFYKESDIQNFKNLKKFSLSSISDSLKYTNKKEDPVDAKINYTVSDIEAFDRIVESNEGSRNNQTEAKIDRSSIKIIDFDKLKKRESTNNKQRVEKIKVVYFD